MTITYQIENPYDIKDELLPLNKEHYKDDFRKEETALDIDWDYYNEAFIAGEMTCFTARDEDKLVGYMTTNICSHQHNKDFVVGSMDTLFVDEEYRNKGIASELFSNTEEFLKDCGVDYLQATFRTEKTAESVTGKFGYKKVEYTYGKSLRNK